MHPAPRRSKRDQGARNKRLGGQTENEPSKTGALNTWGSDLTRVSYQPVEETALLNKKVDNNILLQDGLVLLKHWLDIPSQNSIQEIIFDLGFKQPSGGFYRPQAFAYSDAKMNLQMMCLGRHWNPVARIYEDHRNDHDRAPVHPLSDVLKQWCLQSLADARKISPSIPDMIPTVMLANIYSTSGKLGIHRDKTEDPETIEKGIPVVSFSIGDTGDFMYRDFEKKDKVIGLESGDVLIFGGPSRLIAHAVTQIHPRTKPQGLLMGAGGGISKGSMDCRLNLTFRQDHMIVPEELKNKKQ